MKSLIIIYLFVIFSCEVLYSQTITTVTGTGSSTFSGEGVLAVLANTPGPNGGAFDKHGNYYFCDGVNSHRVRKISVSGLITTVAGNGMGGYAGDGGLATNARLNTPSAVAVDTLGNIFIADAQNFRIRKVDVVTGFISTYAGTGIGGYSGDGGAATLSQFWGVSDICLDMYGNLYIADGTNSRVRKIDVTGIISTIAGNGLSGHSGDGGLAVDAQLGLPSGVCFDTIGSLFIADASSFSNRIRKVDMIGNITTVVGNGGDTYVSDNIPASAAQLVPTRITFDRNNNLFISDRYNNRLYKVSSFSDTLITVAGNGTPGDTGDGGLAVLSTLNYPVGISTDFCGNVYVTTSGSISVPGSGRRIRKVTFNPPTTPTITISGITTATVGATVTVSAAVSGAGSSYTIRWFRNSSLFSTTTTPTTTFTKGSGIDTITARIVPTIVYCYDSTTSAQHRVLEAPVAIGSVPERQQYSVYPNPAQQQLTISSPAPIHTITISSPVGQQWLAYTGSGSTEVRLSVSHLPPGLYIVRVNNSYSTKMIKE